MIGKIRTLATSGIIHYILLRYGTLIIQFVNAIVIAELLGARYFGIYSFLMMVLQYLTYSNLGTNYSLNVALSIKQKSKEFSDQIWGALLYVNHCISVLLILLALVASFISIPYFDKYNFNAFALPVILTAILVNYNSLFVNAYRVHGKLGEINIFQSMPPLLTLLLLPLFTGSTLLNTWVWINLLANLISFLIFLRRSPYPFKAVNHRRLRKMLMSKGIHLLFYNMSFLFIMLSARTVVSARYAVEELGYFSFANSLANSLMLAGGAFAFVFFSKILNRLSSASNAEALSFLNRIRVVYVTPLNFLVLIFMLFVPLLGRFVPEMSPAEPTLLVLLAGQLISNTNMGNTSFMIAKAKERTLTLFGFQAIGIVLIGALAISYFGGDIEHVGVIVVLASAYYSYRVHKLTYKVINAKDPLGWKARISIYFAVAVCLAKVFLGLGNWVLLAAIVGYLVFEWNNLKSAVKDSLALISSSKSAVID